MAGRYRQIEIPYSVRPVIIAAAAEVFPQETIGFLIGDRQIESAIPVQLAERFEDGVRLTRKATARMMDVLGDSIIGDFHSHPNSPPSLSRMYQFRNSREKQWSDEWSMKNDLFSVDGFISLVVSIWPGERTWRTMWAAYWLDGERIRRGRLKWVH